MHAAPPPRVPRALPAAAVADALLTWYSQNARNLPWRRSRDPYAIWISEIMLQQTQVEAVIPYYNRWMRRLPAINNLADAPSALLLQLWAGLGYYRRVRHLQAAAQIIQQKFHGSFPRQFSDILQLPGIGRYTAGAICSIAFNQPTPVLDGNVMRVLTRLLALPGDPRSQPLNARLWQIAQTLLDAVVARQAARSRASGRFNQALMELGALICRPALPRCTECPLQSLCVAAISGTPTAFPSPKSKPAITRRHSAVFVLHHNSRILVRRQDATEWNSGLWCFPTVDIADTPTQPAELLRRHLGFHSATCQPIGKVMHSITRYRFQLDVYQAHLAHNPSPPRNGESWFHISTLRKLPFAAAHRKIWRLARIPLEACHLCP